MSDDATTFKVSARTVLHLGSELISSDAIAFYELIKNAFDAHSPRIDVDVKIRIRQDMVVLARDLLESSKPADNRPGMDESATASLREWLAEGLIADAPDVESWRREIQKAKSYDDFQTILDDANEIVIVDKGHGMSLDDLSDVYLTIGTPFRSIQRNKPTATGRPVLGEKGVGRLSAMRLGDKLIVRTAKSNESYWNILEIDWRHFSANEGALIQSVPLTPKVDRRIAKAEQEHGTTIIIRGLKNSWSDSALKDGAGREIARMMDPFSDKTIFPVSLRFNGKAVEIPRLDKVLFAHAQMSFNGHVIRDPEGLLYLEGTLAVDEEKKGVRRSERLFLTSDEIIALVSSQSEGNMYDLAARNLRRLGPFSLELYWFNRREAEKIDGIGEKSDVQKLIKEWSGGLMVFRDGFRVGRYGGADDDWLELDKKALGQGGYKLNKSQIIGKIDISSTDNPYLVDQTNREGLKDSPEKACLARLLRRLISDKIRQKMNQWEKDAQSADPDAVVRKKFEAAERATERALDAAKRFASSTENNYDEIAEEVSAALAEVSAAMPQVGRFVDRAAKDRSEIIHLASIGLLLEIVAHELGRSVNNSLGAIKQARKSATGTLGRSLLVLEAGLRTIEKRLRLLDPVKTSGRQRKEDFDAIEWVRLIADSHAEQMEASEIQLIVRVECGSKTWPVKMVKGMLVQILENLINNSIYWVKWRMDKEKSQKIRQKSVVQYQPLIEIVLHVRKRTIRVTDNGPGIDADRADDVFEAFWSNRSEDRGHGLGLYISREIAAYNNATLTLSDVPVIHQGKFNSLVLTLPEK